jgi:hypothetical protein
MPKTLWAQTVGAPRAKETTTDAKQISPNLEQVEDYHQWSTNRHYQTTCLPSPQ